MSRVGLSDETIQNTRSEIRNPLHTCILITSWYACTTLFRTWRNSSIARSARWVAMIVLWRSPSSPLRKLSTLFEAADIYGESRFTDAAKRGGDFLILAQLPDPQPAWAQQYNAQMQPAWARK